MSLISPFIAAKYFSNVELKLLVIIVLSEKIKENITMPKKMHVEIVDVCTF